MADRSEAKTKAPVRPAGYVPSIPLLYNALYRKRKEEEEEQYTFVLPEEAQAASKRLPSEVDPPITRDDFQQ